MPRLCANAKQLFAGFRSSNGLVRPKRRVSHSDKTHERRLHCAVAAFVAALGLAATGHFLIWSPPLCKEIFCLARRVVADLYPDSIAEHTRGPR
jgi:hypothetical protein